MPFKHCIDRANLMLSAWAHIDDAVLTEYSNIKVSSVCRRIVKGVIGKSKSNRNNENNRSEAKKQISSI